MFGHLCHERELRDSEFSGRLHYDLGIEPIHPSGQYRMLEESLGRPAGQRSRFPQDSESFVADGPLSNLNPKTEKTVIDLFSEETYVSDTVTITLTFGQKSLSINVSRNRHRAITRKTMLEVALMLAIIGAMLLIFGAIHPITTISCVSPATGECASAINYTLTYAGIATIVAAIGVTFASNKFGQHSAITARIGN